MTDQCASMLHGERGSRLRVLFLETRPDRSIGRPRLSVMVDIWARSSTPSPATEYRVRLAVDTFICLVGDLFVAEITRDSLLDFRDLLQCVPRHQVKAEWSLPLSARYAAWSREQADDRARLSLATIHSKLQIIRAIVRFAYRECWIDKFELRALRLPKRTKQRRSFSKSELRRLFGSDLFIKPWLESCAPDRISPMTLRWVMLIALMTGARLEEVGQLQPEDIREEDGIWAFHVSDRDKSGAPTEKKLKDARAERAVPIHRRLVDLGFLRFVASRRADGARWLFDDLKPDRAGHRTNLLSCRLARIIDRVSTDPRLVFHSLRHSFKDIGRESGLADSINDQLTGHAPRTVGRRYGAGVDRHGLAWAIARLDFEFIDWEPILRAVAASK